MKSGDGHFRCPAKYHFFSALICIMNSVLKVMILEAKPIFPGTRNSMELIKLMYIHSIYLQG
jgi:hypothetical protein